MLVVGLTGGIGSGKSSVAARLAELGAHVLDADKIAREVVAPGTEGLAAVRERFGDHVVVDGALDRAALGGIVFADPDARADLEAITHPRVAQRTAEELARLPQDGWAVHDVPLLVELGYAPRYHLVVVVDAPEPVRVDRLVRAREMAAEDAWARLRAQATRAQRRAVADVWLDNAGAPAQLVVQVDRLVDERLEPLRRRLLARRPVRPGEELPPGPLSCPDGAAERVAARVRHLLEGGGAGQVRTRAEAAGDGWSAVAAVPERPVHEARDALAAGGYVPDGPGRYVAVDPGRPARVTVADPGAG